MNEHRELLSKLLRILFYVHIASLVIFAVNAVSSLESITTWVSKALTLAVIWSLFQLKGANPRYRTAAMCGAVDFICGLLLVNVSTSNLGVSGIAVLAGSVCSLIATYQEYHAHGELVRELDEKLSKKWSNLFVWEIVLGLLTSLVSVIATTILVTQEMDTATVTTIVGILTIIVNIGLSVLYLLYMQRTLKLIENGEE